MVQPLFAKRVTKIPPKSTILFDGSGLSMHLQNAAYTRYIAEDLQSKNKEKTKNIHGNNIGCALVSALSEQERNLIMPCQLKLKILYRLTQ